MIKSPGISANFRTVAGLALIVGVILISAFVVGSALSRVGVGTLVQDPFFLLLMILPVAIVLTHLCLRKPDQNKSRAASFRLQSVLDSITSGLMVIDGQGRIVLVNQAFLQASGLSAPQLQGEPVSKMPWLSTESDCPNLQCEWLDPMVEGESQATKMLTLDAENPRTFLVNLAPIEGRKGDYVGVLASFEDVSELKVKEVRLQQMLDELTLSREEMQRHNDRLRELATKDPLTGCLNRREFFERAEQEWRRAARYEFPLSCVMLDIDFFKSINDSYGHPTGDTVLKKVGSLLAATVRDGDSVCRYGGEEFCILLPHVDHHEAVSAAERLLKQITSTISVDDKPVTASLGVSSLSLDGEHPQGMIEQADRALYVAKRFGRNRVVCFADVDESVDIDPNSLARTSPAEQQGDIAIPFHAVTALVSALGYRDAATADHSRRVADLCVAVASQLMSTSECYIVEIAALLHDIGKIGVPDAILLKPGPLTKDEWDVMGIHDRMGTEIVDSAFNSPMLTDIIKSHHAFFGGSSRHNDLPTGQDIPLGARILAVADTYDAIVSDRVYRKGRSPEEAFAELRRCAGTQFDPEIVEVFIETMQTRQPNQAELSLELNKRTALRIGLQIERISNAIDRDDNESFRALLGRLKLTAQAGNVHEISDLVDALDKAVEEDVEMSAIVGLTSELLTLCRSTQRVFLDCRT